MRVARARADDARQYCVLVVGKAAAGEITTIYGDAGPCDFEGYSIRITDSDWRNTISSFSTRAGCNAVIGRDTQSFSGLSWSWGTRTPTPSTSTTSGRP
ncbi:hypothetical protein [Microlunatus soli]|uniref:Uncharacterized protein n=1 Tax=Microlunatus soli TaxID=630515 RepID=A0A1H1SAV1_9ACTN|nr:hypothetical protein [Microlunatus soli]SDS45117.1 hypothetical protein SAMN04489812_1945 [Microlunatus soli]